MRAKEIGVTCKLYSLPHRGSWLSVAASSYPSFLTSLVFIDTRKSIGERKRGRVKERELHASFILFLIGVHGYLLLHLIILPS